MNNLIGKKILPADIDPSTSVPAYLVNGNELSVYGINTFGSKIQLRPENVKAISHGFGSLDEDDSEATLGHILNSIFVSSPDQVFENLALLDTPGYSKAENTAYSAKTDEKIARAQLNSSNYILWFVPVMSGTITQEDINFLNSLNKDIPRLIIVSKANLREEKETKSVITTIKNVLDTKAVPYVNVLAHSRDKSKPYDNDKIIEQLKKWNEESFENRFAYNFKVIFAKCKEYYDEQIDIESRHRQRINSVLTLSENDVITECFNELKADIDRRILSLETHKNKLKELQNEFFSEIKRIGDITNISMPEPSEIDLIRDKTVDPKAVLDQYCSERGIKVSKNTIDIIDRAFADVESKISETEGNHGYISSLYRIVQAEFSINDKDMKFDFGCSAPEKIRRRIEECQN